jgi:hypothetical protein
MKIYPEIRLQAHLTEAGKRLIAEARLRSAKNKNGKSAEDVDDATKNKPTKRKRKPKDGA